MQNVHPALVKISLVLPQSFNFLLCHEYTFGAVTSYLAYPQCCMMLWFSLSINFHRKWSSVTVTVAPAFTFTSQIGTAIKLRSAQDEKSAWREQLCSLCSWTERCKNLFHMQRCHRLHNTTWLPVPLTSQQGHTHSSRATDKSAE